MTVSRNASMVLVGSVAPLSIAIVSVPIYLAQIGADRYGILLLVWVVLDYFGVFGLGLDASVTNLLARNRNDQDARKKIFWTALLLNASLGIAAGIITFFLGGSLIDKVVDVSSAYRAEILASIPCIAAAIPIITVSAVLIGSLQAFERFFELTLIQFSGTLLLQLGPLAVALWHGADLVSLIATAVASRFVVVILLAIATTQVLGLDCRIRFDIQTIRPLVQFGGWVALTSLVVPILANLDRLLIGLIAGSVSVTYYTVPYNVVAKVLMLPNSLIRALFPRLSIYDDKQARKVSIDAVMTLAVILTPLLVAILFASSRLLSLWLGEEFAIQAGSIPEILIAGLWFNCLAHVPFTFLQARGRPDFVTKLQLLELLPFFAMMWLAVSLGGIKGAAVAWSSRAMIDSVLLSYAAGQLRVLSLQLVLPTAIIMAATAATLCLPAHPAWYIVIFGLLIVSSGIWASANAPQSLRDFLLQIASIRFGRLRRNS